MDINDIKTINTFSTIIEENDVLVDVGANQGDYTEKFMIFLNGTGKIYSIELHPSTFKVLKNKFSNNSNVEILNYGVTNVDKVITYYQGVDSCTHNIIGHDMSFKKNNPLGEIQGIRLDTLLKNESKIKLIKIDVEGAEFSVLQGISGILNKIDYIFVECHLDEDWDSIRELLLQIYKLECKNLITDESIDETSNRAYHCLCKKKL